MSNIFLNNEPVNFEGPNPAGLQGIFNILAQHVATKGERLVSFVIDGEDFMASSGTKFPKQYETIQASSMSCRGYLEQAIQGVLKHADSIKEELSDFSGAILSCPWEDAIPDVARVLELTVPILRILDELLLLEDAGSYPWALSAQSLLRRYRGIVNLYTSAASLRDSAYISDLIVRKIEPIVNEVLKFLKEIEIPQTTSPYESPVI